MTVQAVPPRNALAPLEVEWLAFDFAADPEPPDYLVDGLIERGTVTLLAGDTGTAKTFTGLALAYAAMTGSKWIGRDVSPCRVLAIDEENPERIPKARLRALGMTNAERDKLRYSCRQGVALGAPQWNDWLRTAIEEHEPELVLIDTAMAATNLPDVNDNSKVVALYKELRAIAAEHHIAVVLYHHERKPQLGMSKDPGQATMGARQFAGQADAHLVLTLREREATPTDQEGRRLRTTVTLTVPKLRDDVPPEPELLAIESEKDDKGRLLWAKVINEGPASELLSKTEQLAEQLRAVVRASANPMRSGEIAAALEMTQDGSFDRARQTALANGWIEQVKRGVYAYCEDEGPPL